MKRLLAVAAFAAVAAGIAAAQEPAEVPRRDCSSRIEPTRGRLVFRQPTDVVVGPVSFSSLARFDPRLVGRHRGFFSLKSAAKVREGRAVTLVVPEALRSRLSLAYARGARLDRFDPRFSETKLEPCPPATPGFRRATTVGPVTGFNGGFVFTRRGCYPIEVRVDGRTLPYRKRVPLGTSARCSPR